MRHLIYALLLFATPAMAQNACDDVWFTRNLHFDRAGYCFGSALGQALFDNSNCIGKNVTLSPQAKAQVDEIKRLEAFHGCKVDTSRTWIEFPDLGIRRQLHDLPIRDEFESACIGWLGPVVPLHAGHSGSTPVIGQITAGDTVGFAFVPVGNWTYVTTHTGDWKQIKSGGWLPSGSTHENICSQWAG